ncbi:MAG: cyclic nucleotide-binding domain-containing protein [Caldilineaceae bacterium]
MAKSRFGRRKRTEARKEGAASYRPQSAVNSVLPHVSFLEGLPTGEALDVLKSGTEFQRLGQGTVLTQQDSEADYLYYLVQGQVLLERNRPSARDPNVWVPVVQRTLEPGVLIGRFALIYNLPYTSQATAKTDVLVLRFRTSALERLLYRFPQIRGKIIPQETINRLRTMPIFRGVEPVTLSYLAEEAQTQKFDPENVVYTHDRPPSHLYLIDTGQVILYNPRLPDRQLWLGTGNAIGFPGSIGPGAPSADRYGHWAVTKAPTQFYKIPWASLERLALRYPHVIDSRIQFEPFETLREVSVFREFSDEQRRKLAGFCSFQHIPQHHLILQQGDIGDSMWILLKDGKATISALDQDANALPRVPVDGVVYFHEMALRAARNVRATVETEPNSFWLRLHWRDFRRFVNETDPALHKNSTSKSPKKRRRAGRNSRKTTNGLGRVKCWYLTTTAIGWHCWTNCAGRWLSLCWR